MTLSHDGAFDRPLPVPPRIRRGIAGTVLVLDDDGRCADGVAALLGGAGLEVEVMASFPGLDRDLARFGADVLILDTRLRHADGLTLIRALAAASERPGILVHSEHGEAIDRVLALELGADDHVCKPCDGRELIARVRALIRRAPRAAPRPREDAAVPPRLARFGEWRLDLETRTLIDAAGRAEPLPNAEFHVLAALVSRRGRTVSRRELLEASGLNDADDRGERAVDVQVCRLRGRLETGEELVRTVRGQGYLFLAPVSFE